MFQGKLDYIGKRSKVDQALGIAGDLSDSVLDHCDNSAQSAPGNFHFIFSQFGQRCMTTAKLALKRSKMNYIFQNDGGKFLCNCPSS